jgi:hypothetical protein
MSAKLDALLSVLDNHIARIIKNPQELVHDDAGQRKELGSWLDAYVDERVELKLRELGILK